MRIRDFEECPICHKKGWYVEQSEYNLAHFKLHQCKYCHSVEKVNFTPEYKGLKLYDHYLRAAPNNACSGLAVCVACEGELWDWYCPSCHIEYVPANR